MTFMSPSTYDLRVVSSPETCENLIVSSLDESVVLARAVAGGTTCSDNAAVMAMAPRMYRALLRVLNEFVGISPGDLTTAERNVVDQVCAVLEATMPADEFGQFDRPVRREE